MNQYRIERSSKRSALLLHKCGEPMLAIGARCDTVAEFDEMLAYVGSAHDLYEALSAIIEPKDTRRIEWDSVKHCYVLRFEAGDLDRARTVLTKLRLQAGL